MTAKSTEEKKKAIKSLLQDASILAIVLLIFISISAIMQRRQIERMQSQITESELQLDKNKTALQNIQEENEYLKKQVESMKLDIESLVRKSSADNVEIASLEDKVNETQERLDEFKKLVDRLNILLNAQQLYNSKKYKDCKALLEQIEPYLDELPEPAKAVYDELYSKVRRY